MLGLSMKSFGLENLISSFRFQLSSLVRLPTTTQRFVKRDEI
jgi:hypothetical protein